MTRSAFAPITCRYAYAEGSEGAAKRSVFDALSLYLNFINLFMLLLQLLGNRNSN